MANILCLEMNEINFDFVEKYCAEGFLPNFGRLIQDKGLVKTLSEKEFVNLEPWIQWVTFYTGKSYSEHGIFRLGDGVNHHFPQIWERISEKTGRGVVAISPMNAPNRIEEENSLFVPDPWTNTTVTGDFFTKSLYLAVRDAVNANSLGEVSVKSLLRLLVGLLPLWRRVNPLVLLRLYKASKRNRWYKALILDYLLSVLFVHQVKKKRPVYGSVFLNAGAHIQHHYMFDSSLYKGCHSNPKGYASEELDPLLEVYKMYDEILAYVVKSCPEYRVMIVTGLSQKPNPKKVYYYRPRSHEELLRAIGISGFAVEPRMSRDMLISFGDSESAALAEKILKNCFVLSEGGELKEPLFYLENRGDSIFVMVSYKQPLVDGDSIFVGSQVIGGFSDFFVHVSVENAIHRSVGFLLDTGSSINANSIDLKDVGEYIYSLTCGDKL